MDFHPAGTGPPANAIALADAHSWNGKAERECVLIVDDSATMRLHYSKLLGDRYDCFQAQNTVDALEKLKLHRIDLVITDVIMPGLSGVELLRMVLDRYP